MLEIFRNTLTANDNYPVGDSGNLLSSIQMQLSLKPNFFSNFLDPFLESTSNFTHFEKKDDRHTYFISKFPECEKRG